MESDYQMAHDAIPGALKTIEGFWIVDPDNEDLIGILTEGYCQYGTAFVEDDWEVAKFAKQLDKIESVLESGNLQVKVSRSDDDKDGGHK